VKLPSIIEFFDLTAFGALFDNDDALLLESSRHARREKSSAMPL